VDDEDGSERSGAESFAREINAPSYGRLLALLTGSGVLKPVLLLALEALLCSITALSLQHVAYAL